MTILETLLKASVDAERTAPSKIGPLRERVRQHQRDLATASQARDTRAMLEEQMHLILAQRKLIEALLGERP